MNTTFKKTLVASAVFAFAGVAQAATLAGTTHTVTSQYLAGTTNPTGAATTADHQAAAFTITLGADYTLNDTMTLTFTAPVKTALPSSITASGAGLASVTFSLISGGTANSSTATYRVTAIDTTAGTSSINAVATMPAANLQFAKSNLSSGASVSFSAKTNTGLDLDTGGGTARTASLVTTATQFTAANPNFSRVIDVNADRKKFVDLDANAVNATDFQVSGTFNITSLTTGGTTFARPIAATAGVKHTLTGDFSWVVDDNATAAGLQPKANVFTSTGTCANPAWTYSTTAVSLTCDALAADTAIVIDPEANKVGVATGSIPVLPAQAFTATSTVTFTDPAATENVLANVGAGSWTLNGSQVRVPYMVMKDGRFGTILNLTNHSTQSGTIVFDLYAEDGTKLQTSYAGGTATAGAVTSIAGAVRQALIDSGKDVVNNTVKYSLQITTNVPANDVIVYSAYTDAMNGGERAIVNNDSKVQTK